MLELDLAISPFSHLAARAAYCTTQFKVVNNKLVDKFRSRLIPSVHVEILKRFNLRHNFETYGHRFESFVKRQFGMAVTSYNPPEAYHYYVDAVTHPNMPFKQLKRYADTTVMGLCHQMWGGELCFPMLADALEDQDFPDLDYLNHLRVHPQFSKANFVLQFFLNKRIGWPRGMRTSHREVGPTPRFQYQNVLGQLRRTQMNHPIQSRARDMTEQLILQGILRVGDGEFEVTNFTIQERPDELDVLRANFLEQLREQDDSVQSEEE